MTFMIPNSASGRSLVANRIIPSMTTTHTMVAAAAPTPA
jgi:hypothetical protein